MSRNQNTAEDTTEDDAVSSTVDIREGAAVVGSDGSTFGDVERIVVDPVEGSVTHFVVSRGLIFTEERVVPAELVSQSDEEMIVLAAGVDPSDLPVFEEVHFVEADDETARSIAPNAAAAPLIWGYPAWGLPPVSGAPLYPAYPPGTKPKVRRNVPASSETVRTGSSVIASDGKDVGKVRQATVAEDGSLAAIEVDPGWFKSEVTIPAHFVRAVGEDRIELAVGSETVARLERG